MQTARNAPRPRVLWLLVVWMILAGAAPVRSQCLVDEVVKSIKITQPPAFDQTKPFRTNRPQINIGFEHDGASGSYLIKTLGADVDGSTFLPLPTDKSGNVLAGFNTDGIKQVGVGILQQKCNVFVESRATGGTNGVAFIQFDTKPPIITIQSVTIGPNPPNNPTPFNNQTFITKEDQVTITGQAVDPDNGSPPQDIKITIKNTANNQSQTVQLDQATGTFNTNIALAGIADGPVNIEITAEDKMTDPNTTPNKSLATVLKFVRDKTAPKVQLLEIIRFDGDPARKQILSPSAKAFVGQEIVLLRVTMSEKMGSPPQVQVTQNGGSKIPATILADRTVNDTQFVYQYNTIPVEAQNGPAKVEITGQFDGNGPLPDFGFDLANNPIAQNDPSATFAQAFSVDTVAPDLTHLPNPPPPGQFVSVPKDGQVIGKDGFPQTIQVFVDDFNTSNPTEQNKNFGSGVDFTNVSNAATTTTSGLTISLKGPAGDIPGTPSVSPPTGLFLNLPDFTGSANSNPNFTDRDGDGKKEPLDGNYTITVNLIDKVGNKSTKTISFRVDTVPVSAESIGVNLAGCISLQARELPPIVVSSKDPDFNVTATNVEFFSQIGGPNSVPVKFDSDTPIRAAPATPGASATITLNNVRKPGQAVGTDQFPFPVPNAPTPFVPPGSIDPRQGANDGFYFVRVTPKDQAGNSGTISTTSGRRQAFVDFPVQIDNTDPFVERVYPPVDQAIAGPLNFFEAVVVDPVATNGNAGCGIDVNATQLVARLEVAYQPNRVPATFVDTPGAFPSKLRGTIKFIHIPNSIDPTRNDFNPKDDRFRVALEFTDPLTGRTRNLPTDGSMDGIYSIAVNPVDRAGNSIGINPLSPARLGTYHGLQPGPESTINIGQFFFLIDNTAPLLELDNFPDGVLLTSSPGRLAGSSSKAKTGSVANAVGTSGVTQGPVIGARPFRVTGAATDLSAQHGASVGGQNDPSKGGADIDRVEYFLEVVTKQGPVPGEPATIDPATGDIKPAKNNPIIPVTRAVLDPVQITDPPPGDDATRTTSRPMDASFAGTTRERRKFTIDDILPSDDRLLKPKTIDEFYQFTVRAIDRAGNVTTLPRKVSVDLNDVKPPSLLEPRDNSYIKTPIVKFKWANVTGIRKFRFVLTPPPGSSMKPIERIVTKTADQVSDAERNVVQLTLPEEGLWKWTVASFDQVGNEGQASAPFRLTVDLTPPRILGNKATVTGDVQPTNRSGVIGIGTFNVRIEFSETLKTAPTASWQPASPSTGAIELTTMGFTGSVLECQGQIPRNADPRVFDGRASLIVNFVTDLAGNTINGQNQVTIDGFEVDTGPSFQSRFFISPLTPSELTLVVLASEELQGPPRFTELTGLAQLGNEAFRMAGNPRAFYTTLKVLQPNLNQVAKATLSATDLDGNVSRRDVAVAITKIKSGQTSTLKAPGSDFSVAFPADAVKGEATAYMFPAHETFASDVGAPGLAKASAEPSTPAATQGLIDLGPLPELQPSGLKLDAAATLNSAMPSIRGVDPRRVGVYQSSGGRWRWIGGQGGGGRLTGRFKEFAPLRLMADTAVPQILEVTPSDGEPLETGRPTITATLTDAGSGVAKEGIALALDGATVTPFIYDEAQGRVSFTPAQDLAPGQHAVELTVRDRAGNVAPVKKIGLVAPDQFGFSEPVVMVPNPVRAMAGGFSLALTQPLATASLRLDIYDAAGDRIRTLSADGPFAGKRQTLAWDLLTDDGTLVQNGVFLFRVRANSFTGSKAQSRGKIAVLR